MLFLPECFSFIGTSQPEVRQKGLGKGDGAQRQLPLKTAFSVYSYVALDTAALASLVVQILVYQRKQL
jgi:hypothetical protein